MDLTRGTPVRYCGAVRLEVRARASYIRPPGQKQNLRVTKPFDFIANYSFSMLFGLFNQKDQVRNQTIHSEVKKQFATFHKIVTFRWNNNDFAFRCLKRPPNDPGI